VGDEFADTNSLVIDLNKLVEYLSALPRYYPHDNSIKTLPLVLDAIVTAIRLGGKELFNRKERRQRNISFLSGPTSTQRPPVSSSDRIPSEQATNTSDLPGAAVARANC